MVDLSRLLKKVFIANKQGFREFGSEKKEEEKADKESGKALPTLGRFAHKEQEQEFLGRAKKLGNVQESQPQPRQPTTLSRKFSLPSIGSGSSSSGIPAAMGVYIGLFIIASLGTWLKKLTDFSPALSLFISLLLGIFFFIGVKVTPENKVKESLVFIAFAFDTFAQYMLGFFPESTLKRKMVMLHVFVWMALSIVLFLMGIFDRLGAGEKLPWWAWLLTAFILGFILVSWVLPFILQGPWINQDKTHAEYFNIAKEELFGAGKTFQETTNSGLDYFYCSIFQATQFDKCLENEKILSYCEANFKTVTEQQDCIKQQQEILKSGGKAGVAGSVSEAIKQVTKVELKEDQFFPKKATEPRTVYPIPLKVENPREQIFAAQVSCDFKKGKETIAGAVSIGGQAIAEVQINDRQEQFLIGCQPSSDLNGRYTLEYTVILSGMQTFSFLKRAFISKEIDSAVRLQVEADYFKSTKEKASQGPAEFALLNFKFGTGVGTEPLVLVEEPTTFSFAVEDVGTGAFKGEVLKVNNYNFHGLWERGFSVDSERIGDEDCLQGGEIKLLAAQTKKREPSELKRCFLTLPPDLSQLQKDEYKVETFVADLNYDYKITKSIPIEVTPFEKPSPELVS